MIKNVVFAALWSVILCGPVFSADPSPQPTTSPTTSGKQTLKASGAGGQVLKTLNKAELSRFVSARNAISENIVSFNNLVNSGSKSRNQKEALKRIAGEITKQAAHVQRYAKLTNNKIAEKVASKLIIDDDVTGRQVSAGALAKQLLELDAQLALLEPVVHR